MKTNGLHALMLALAGLAPLHLAAAPVQGRACFTPTEEAKLLSSEKISLGDRHAAEHAQGRIVRCEVERGMRRVPAKEIRAKDGEESLRDEVKKRQEVLEVVQKIRDAKK